MKNYIDYYLIMPSLMEMLENPKIQSEVYEYIFTMLKSLMCKLN